MVYLTSTKGVGSWIHSRSKIRLGGSFTVHTRSWKPKIWCCINAWWCWAKSDLSFFARSLKRQFPKYKFSFRSATSRIVQVGNGNGYGTCLFIWATSERNHKHDVQLTAKLDPGVNGVPVPRLAVRISNPDSYSSSKKKQQQKTRY